MCACMHALSQPLLNTIHLQLSLKTLHPNATAKLKLLGLLMLSAAVRNNAQPDDVQTAPDVVSSVSPYM